jgi:hypothetical protein
VTLRLVVLAFRLSCCVLAGERFNDVNLNQMFRFIGNFVKKKGQSQELLQKKIQQLPTPSVLN